LVGAIGQYDYITMGGMFTIPALLLWLVWQFGHGTTAKLRPSGTPSP